MPSVRYGTRVIEYTIQEKQELKSHYITVDRNAGVVLKGKPVNGTTADRLILKKAKWVIDKLQIVKRIDSGDIVTGSRISYLGRSYYVQLVVRASVKKVTVAFNHSKFTITVKSHSTSQKEIMEALQLFYAEKAIEKITPRVEKLSQKTGLSYPSLHFRKMHKRWGSCTGSNRIIINPEAIKLPFSLIDYLIVHELVHTKVKDHSKMYWAMLARHVRNWKELDERLKQMKY